MHLRTIYFCRRGRLAESVKCRDFDRLGDSMVHGLRFLQGFLTAMSFQAFVKKRKKKKNCHCTATPCANHPFHFTRFYLRKEGKTTEEEAKKRERESGGGGGGEGWRCTLFVDCFHSFFFHPCTSCSFFQLYILFVSTGVSNRSYKTYCWRRISLSSRQRWQGTCHRAPWHTPGTPCISTCGLRHTDMERRTDKCHIVYVCALGWKLWCAACSVMATRLVLNRSDMQCTMQWQSDLRLMWAYSNPDHCYRNNHWITPLIWTKGIKTISSGSGTWIRLDHYSNHNNNNNNHCNNNVNNNNNNNNNNHYKNNKDNKSDNNMNLTAYTDAHNNWICFQLLTSANLSILVSSRRAPRHCIDFSPRWFPILTNMTTCLFFFFFLNNQTHLKEFLYLLHFLCKWIQTYSGLTTWI